MIKKPPQHDHPPTQASQLMFEYRTCWYLSQDNEIGKHCQQIKILSQFFF